MVVTGPSFSDIVHEIGHKFDGNRNGALKGAEKWAFLAELAARLAPFVEQGAIAGTQNNEAAPGTVTRPIGSAESAPVGNSADQIDLSTVSWLDTNVSDWAKTSTITRVNIGSPPIDIEHTKAGQWPSITAGGTGLLGHRMRASSLRSLWP